MEQKTIIIFANSIKHNNHCIAGKDVNTKEWIRPVSNENGGELTDKQITYKNKYGTYLAKPLQKMKINFIKKAPLLNQPENYIISNNIWEQNFKIERNQIINYIDNPDNLWLDNTTNTDRINYNLIKNNQIIIKQSLYLIYVENIHIYWKDRSNLKQNPQRRGKFKYKNIIYDLPITDPNFENFIEKKLEKKFLCISLGEEFNGYCYKLIASIL